MGIFLFGCTPPILFPMLTGKTLKELQTSSLALNTGTTITDEYSSSISVPMFSHIYLSYILLKVANNRQVKITEAQQNTGAGEPKVEAGQPHQVFFFLINCLLLISFATSFWFTIMFPTTSVQFVSNCSFPYILKVIKCSMFSSYFSHITHSKAEYIHKFKVLILLLTKLFLKK